MVSCPKSRLRREPHRLTEYARTTNGAVLNTVLQTDHAVGRSSPAARPPMRVYLTRRRVTWAGTPVVPGDV